MIGRLVLLIQPIVVSVGHRGQKRVRIALRAAAGERRVMRLFYHFPLKWYAQIAWVVHSLPHPVL